MCFILGMANKKRVTREQMEDFTARLMGRPELYEQFVRILDLTDPAGGGKGLDLNMLESFLIPEIRETGRIATQHGCGGIKSGRRS